MNEQEKKRAYNERILQMDHGTFTSLGFSINDIMRRECQNVLVEKRDLPQSISSNRFEQKLAFDC